MEKQTVVPREKEKPKSSRIGLFLVNLPWVFVLIVLWWVTR